MSCYRCNNVIDTNVRHRQYSECKRYICQQCAFICSCCGTDCPTHPPNIKCDNYKSCVLTFKINDVIIKKSEMYQTVKGIGVEKK